VQEFSWISSANGRLLCLLQIQLHQQLTARQFSMPEPPQEKSPRKCVSQVFPALNLLLFISKIMRVNSLSSNCWKEGVGAGMLVLSRKRDERIVIGDNIVITVVDVRGDKVRLGIEAPPEVPVHRQEIVDALKRAAASQPKSEAGPS
jgi:carbon storage regulator